MSAAAPNTEWCIGCCQAFANTPPTNFQRQGWYEFKDNCYCTGCWQKLFWVLRKLVPCPV
jgi:hypothetical protein